MDSLDNFQEKIAIVVVGYNRKHALARLLQSLNEAEYPSEDIPLIISLDNGGGQDIHDYVDDFKWEHGYKICIFHEENLKLRKHIFYSISLSEHFKGVIILEDDLYVSPVFYYYAQQALDFYGDDNRIASISLYNTATSNFTKLPLYIMHGSADVYAAQMVETWGECFNYRMWKNFRSWYEANPEIDWDSIDIYDAISTWKDAWSKYLFAYMITNNKYYIFPYVSLTTCFCDPGVHASNTRIVNTQQVILQYDKRRYNLESFDKLYQYDVYFNPCNLGSVIGVRNEELTVDFYNNRKLAPKHYLLTPYVKKYKIVKTYGLRLKPIEMNIYKNIKGMDIYLYDTYIKCNRRNKINKKSYLNDYFFDPFFKKNYYYYVMRNFVCAIFRKIYSSIRF